MRWIRAALLMTAHAATACVTPTSSAGKPATAAAAPVPPAPMFSDPTSVAPAETCVSRVRTSGGAFFALDAHERSKRVQAALALKYPGRNLKVMAETDPMRPEAAPKIQLAFRLLPKRWGADGPVPWEEVALPNLQRFTEPLALYYTQLSTGEFEYPWVSGLVVARQAGDELELNLVESAAFSEDIQVIESLLLEACAGTLSLRSQLTLAVRDLYALGGAQPDTKTTRDGSCTVAEFYLYDDVWRYLAVDFTLSGRVRHIYSFNSKDDQDMLRRRTLCTDHVAEP